MKTSYSDEQRVALCSGLQHQGWQNKAEGGTSSWVSWVMSLMTRDVLEQNEDPKKGKEKEAFELPGNKKSGVSESGTARLPLFSQRSCARSCLSVSYVSCVSPA